MNKFFNKNQLNKVFVSVFHLACNAYFMKITLCLRTIKGAIWSYVYGQNFYLFRKNNNTGVRRNYFYSIKCVMQQK